jgi:hypothetical protein
MKKEKAETPAEETPAETEPVALRSLPGREEPPEETQTSEETFELSSLACQMLDDLSLHFGGIDRCSAVSVAIALAYNDMVGGED